MLHTEPLWIRGSHSICLIARPGKLSIVIHTNQGDCGL